MFTISIAQISIWIWSNALYKFQRAQPNKVGVKEPCCRLGAQPLNTIHIWPWSSTAPQPDGLDWESILRLHQEVAGGKNCCLLLLEALNFTGYCLIWRTLTMCTQYLYSFLLVTITKVLWSTLFTSASPGPNLTMFKAVFQKKKRIKKRVILKQG